MIGSSNDDVMGLFLEKPMGAPEVKPLLSDEHFSVARCYRPGPHILP